MCEANSTYPPVIQPLGAAYVFTSNYSRHFGKRLLIPLKLFCEDVLGVLIFSLTKFSYSQCNEDTIHNNTKVGCIVKAS